MKSRGADASSRSAEWPVGHRERSIRCGELIAHRGSRPSLARLGGRFSLRIRPVAESVVRGQVRSSRFVGAITS